MLNLTIISILTAEVICFYSHKSSRHSVNVCWCGEASEHLYFRNKKGQKGPFCKKKKKDLFSSDFQKICSTFYYTIFVLLIIYHKIQISPSLKYDLALFKTFVKCLNCKHFKNQKYKHLFKNIYFRIQFGFNCVKPSLLTFDL